MKTRRLKARAAIGLIFSLIVSVGITAYALTSQEQTQTPPPQLGQPPDAGTLPKGEAPGPGYDAGSLPPEITLDQALSDENIKVIVPKYLPPNAKLDVARKSQAGSEYCITLNYDLGNNWIDVIAIKSQNPITQVQQIQLPKPSALYPTEPKKRSPLTRALSSQRRRPKEPGSRSGWIKTPSSL